MSLIWVKLRCRSMSAQGIDYSHGRHIAAVQAAARVAGIKGAPYAVLSYLCSAADFRKPTVRVSKATICERTGYCWTTVQAALRCLRDAGFIHPVAYATGGRNRATVYSLRTQKGMENATPLEAAEPEKGDGFSTQKGMGFPLKRGWKKHPPSMDHSNDPSKVERGAYSAGVQSRHLDARQDAGPVAGAALTAQERALLEAMQSDLKTMSYGEARLLDKQRRAKLEAEKKGDE